MLAFFALDCSRPGSSSSPTMKRNLTNKHSEDKEHCVIINEIVDVNTFRAHNNGRTTAAVWNIKACRDVLPRHHTRKHSCFRVHELSSYGSRLKLCTNSNSLHNSMHRHLQALYKVEDKIGNSVRVRVSPTKKSFPTVVHGDELRLRSLCCRTKKSAHDIISTIVAKVQVRMPLDGAMAHRTNTNTYKIKPR